MFGAQALDWVSLPIDTMSKMLNDMVEEWTRLIF